MQRSAARAALVRNGLSIVTALFAAAGIVASIVGSAVGAAVSMLGVIVTATLQIRATELARGQAEGRSAKALSALGEVARQFTTAVATCPVSFGSTSLFDQGQFKFELARLGDDIKAHRFNFAEGRRQFEWGTLGACLRTGRSDFVARAGAIDGLPATDLAAVRELGEVGERAARRAFMVASAYAAFNVDEPHPTARFRGPDQNVDLTTFTPYGDLGDDIIGLAAGLQHYIAFAAPIGLPGYA